MSYVLILVQNKRYEDIKQLILRFIKKHGNGDYSFILNEINIDYDALVKGHHEECNILKEPVVEYQSCHQMLSRLRREGQLRQKSDDLTSSL